MKNDETKYNNEKLTLPVIILLIVLVIIFYIMLPIGLIYGIIKVYTAPLTETGFFQTEATKILVLFALVLLLCIIISSIIGSITGRIKGKKFIDKENKKINKTNPYIYYRELPNNYGIGVTSLLFDSKIENYKDIIAVILDLCAKKYISLIKENDKYYIQILKGSDDELLSNEKYILNLLISHNIKNINYREWYDYCVQDGVNLGIYYHEEKQRETINDGLVTRKEAKRFNKIHRDISLFIGLVRFVLGLIEGHILGGALWALIWFIVSYVVLIVPFYIIFVFTGVVNMGKMQKKVAYDKVLNNHLIRTDKGMIELQKLISFKNFLSDFGNFVDKHIEEVVLWDRYLSYAQVFGLTKEIMKSGYNQLINNSSFQIDDIDNITIYNIEFEK